MDALEVCALGPSGSGKTVLMASLYNRLRILRQDTTFYVSSDQRTALTLNAAYDEVANPDRQWPHSSTSIEEWEFAINVSTPSATRQPLTIRYVDYPGAILTNRGTLEDARYVELFQRLRAAHGLLILLNGVELGKLMRGEQAGRRYLQFEMGSSFEIAQQSRCPIQFVITKWDQLQDQYSLGAVREELMRDDDFADLVRAKQRDGHTNIRLIPVSSVGRDFVVPQADGSMRKTDMRPRPYNVEVPLISTLPDFLQHACAELEGRDAALADSVLAAEQQVPSAVSSDRVRRFVGLVAGRYMPRAVEKALRRNPALAALIAGNSEYIVRAVGDLVERTVRNREERKRLGHDAYLADLEKQRLDVRNDREAFEIIEKQFEMMITEFELAHPDSVLVGGTTEFLRALPALPGEAATS